MNIIKLANLRKTIVPKIKKTFFSNTKSRLCDGVVTVINGEFRVLVNIPNQEEEFKDKLCLPLSEKSLSLKGKTLVFSVKPDENGKYINYYRDELNAYVNYGSREQYASVAPDQVVTGYIVRYANKLEFELEACHGRGSFVRPYEINDDAPLFKKKS